MTRKLPYGLVLAGCAIAGVIIAGPAASTSTTDRLGTVDVSRAQVSEELPPAAPATASTSSPDSTIADTTPTTNASNVTATDPSTSTVVDGPGDIVENDDDDHQHASEASDTDVAVLVILAGTANRYDTPAAARGYYLHQLATSEVVEAFGSLTDTERSDRVVKMSALASEPETTNDPTDTGLLIVDVLVEVTTFSATADRTTVQLDVTATVDTQISRVVDVELSEV